MKKYYFLSVILAALFFSCSKENSAETLDTDDTKKASCLYDVQGFAIGYNNVIKQIHNIMDVLDNSEKANTRLSPLLAKKRSIKNIQIIAQNETPKVRGKELGLEDAVDTLVYLVNFDANKGYVLLSGDTRVDAILAIADKGSLDLHNIPDNSNLIPLLENAEGLYNRMIDHTHPHSLPIDDVEGEYTHNRYGPWKIASQTAPLVPVNWGQRSPFNTDLPLINGKLPPAGCVTTAVVQIMAANRTPSRYHWSVMINDLHKNGKKEVARLYKDVATVLKTEYGEKGSSANNRDVPVCFRQFGLLGTHNVENYSWKALKGDITNGRPVYMSAFGIRKTNYKRNWIFWKKKYYTYENGHAWVLDGLRVMERKVETINSKGNVIGSRYVIVKLI